MQIFVYVKAAFATVLCLASLGVNIPVIIVTSRSETLKNDHVTSVMCSMAVSDVVTGAGLFGISAVVAWVQPRVVPYAFTQVQGFLFYLYSHNAFWHLAFASVIKCGVIVWPLTYLKVFTDRTINLTLMAIWIVNIVFDCILFVIGVRYSFDWIQILPVLMNYFTFVPPLRLLSFFASTICMGMCYAKIFLVVRKQLASTAPEGMPSGLTSDSAGRLTSQIKDKFLLNVRSAKTIFIICAAFLLAYTPFTIKGLTAYNNVAFAFASRWIHEAGSFTNGLLYVLLHKKVRTEFKKMLGYVTVSDNLERSTRLSNIQER